MGLTARFLLRPRPLRSLPARVRLARVEFPELVEEVATPELERLPLRAGAGSLRRSSYVTPAASLHVLTGLFFHSGYHVLHTRGREAVAESISTRLPPRLGLRDCYGLPVTRIEGPCTTFRSVRNGFYHTMIDNLPRLYLLHHEAARAFGPVEVLCGSAPTAVERHHLERLLPEGAKVVVVPEKSLCVAERFLLPDFLSRRFSGYLPSRYLEWFLARVAPARPRARRHRLLISRAPTQKGAQRIVLNEDELARALEPLGFRRTRLESLPVEEQISLFHDAEFVVAPHGAGLANLLYAREAKVLELFSTPRIAPHYSLLAKSTDCRYAYWCADAERQNSSFRVDVEAVLARVAALERP